jgi:hypothetical protein
MAITRRVFVSMPVDSNIRSPRQKRFKAALLQLIRKNGFEPQEFFVSGISGGMSWSFRAVDDVVRRCHGALIWAYPRWEFGQGEEVFRFPSEYTHYEGAVANTYKLPILTIAERGLMERGFIWNGGGNPILWAPSDPGAAWLESEAFRLRFNLWLDAMQERRDVFFGYSSRAKGTAKKIRDYLEERGATVMDWTRDFFGGGTILEEIDRADRLCSSGIFLFTKDDPLVRKSGSNQAAPRDNVVFEAGYFVKSKGKERALIIREAGAKMPADVGGNIYLRLEKRGDISSIREQLRKFLANRL